MKRIILGIMIVLGCALSACVEFDESTLITDDNGHIHRTTHYLRDKRGWNYFPKQVRNIGERQFVFDPKASAWAAYDETGKLVMTGSASGGKDRCDEDGKSCRTVTGTFRIYNKRNIDCKSGEYPVETHGGTKMPYCMYFNRGYTIHAAFEVPPFPSSHGCVRVLPSAAKWLNEEFMRIGTKVTVLAYPDENGVRVG
jgi:L,D-transpeptidase catalytic domain